MIEMANSTVLTCNWWDIDTVIHNGSLDQNFFNISLNLNSSTCSIPYLHLYASGTFFVQLFRFLFLFFVMFAVAFLYSKVSALGKSTLNAATCSFYWILFFTLASLKSFLYAIFLPCLSAADHHHESLPHASLGVTLAAFALLQVFQCSVAFLLVLAIDHERLHRSTTELSANQEKCCSPHTVAYIFCSPLRLFSLLLAILPLLLMLVSVSMFADLSNRNETRSGNSSVADNLETPLHVFEVALLFSLVLVRVCVVCVAFLLCCTTRNQKKLRPTIAGIVFLLVGVAFSVVEDLPSSVFSCYSHVSTLCLNIHDIVQLVGLLSFFFLLLFIKSQYLRVEQECKLAVVWDVQSLLRVSGKSSVVKYKSIATTSEPNHASSSH